MKLADAVPYPIKSHGYGLRFLKTDCAVGESNGTLVVTKNGRRGLEVPEVSEYTALVNANLSIGIDSGILGLGNRPYYYGYKGGVAEGGGIEGGVVGVTEEVVAAGYTTVTASIPYRLVYL